MSRHLCMSHLLLANIRLKGGLLLRWLQGDYLVLMLLLPLPGLIGRNQIALLLPHYFFLPRTRHLGNYRYCNIGDGVWVFGCLEKGRSWCCGGQDPGGTHDIQGDYENAISAYLSFKKVVSLCRNPKVLAQQKATCIEQIELAQSHLTMVHTDLDALHETHRNVVQRITNLEETLRLTREEECQLKRDV